MERLHLLDGKYLKRAALRDALLNAVSHKDYSSSVPNQISAYPDKLMIWNPGQLPPDWTIRHLLEKHASLPFNPDIANVFFRAGMVESWGRGIERIMQACSEAGIPAAELRHEQTGLWITFTFMPAETTLGKKKSSEKSSEKIIAIIRNTPHVSARNIAEQLGLTSRAVEKQIAQLKAAGRLKRIGPARGGYWEVVE